MYWILFSKVLNLHFKFHPTWKEEYASKSFQKTDSRYDPNGRDALCYRILNLIHKSARERKTLLFDP